MNKHKSEDLKISAVKYYLKNGNYAIVKNEFLLVADALKE